MNLRQPSMTQPQNIDSCSFCSEVISVEQVSRMAVAHAQVPPREEAHVFAGCFVHAV